MQKKNKISVAIDIDLVCTKDLGQRWWDFLTTRYFDFQTDAQYCKFCSDYENGVAEYNLSKYFNLPDHIDSMSFWKQPNLYDNEDLAEGCYEVVKNLYEAGIEIAFVSHTNFEHIHSKYDFIKRHFDFLSNNDDLHFIATRSKFCTDGAFDIIIDDRNENLEYATNALLIKMKTPYKQYRPLDKPHTVCKTWRDVENVICDWMEDAL